MSTTIRLSRCDEDLIDSGVHASLSLGCMHEEFAQCTTRIASQASSLPQIGAGGGDKGNQESEVIPGQSEPIFASQTVHKLLVRASTLSWFPVRQT